MEDKTIKKNSLEFGEHERIQIVEGLQSKISAYKRYLADSKEEDEQPKRIKKTLEDAEQELQEFQAIKSVPSIYKEEGTEKPMVYYSDYLMLNRILNSQHLLSEEIGKKPAHDEMLFIVIHQVYELWFKQILHEVKQAISLISGKFVPSSDIGKIVHHLSRVTEIQKILLQQINVLETMSPMDFMEFRDYLFPASGFQSYQFRLLENLLGIDQSKRILHERKAYHTKLSAEHQHAVQVSEKSTTLFDVVQSWLERFPFFNVKDFDFLKAYQSSVTQMLIKDKQAVMRNTKEESQPINSQDPSTDRDHAMASLQVADERFRALFDESFHNEQIASGRLRLSFKATQAALLVLAYENEPLLYAPSRLLHTLLDIDENLAEWRFKHMMMTQRMIGSRVGTGGSSGYWYLKSTVERSKVFTDIANLSSFLIPRSELPNLPQALKVNLGFYHEVITEEQHSQLQKNV